jgi:DNA-binding MarR family transcriptional regulator
MKKEIILSQDSSGEVSQFEQSLILLNNVMRKHRTNIEGQFQVSALEMELLQFVVTNGPQKMKAVSENFDIKLSTLTSIIDKAEKRKVLKRVNSRTDRRVVFLESTRKGEKLFVAYRKSLHELANEMKDVLTDGQLNQFVTGIELFNELSFN